MKEVSVESINEYISVIKNIFENKQQEYIDNFIDLAYTKQELKKKKEAIQLNSVMSPEEVFFKAKEKQTLEKEIDYLTVFERNNKTSKGRTFYNESMDWHKDALKKYTFFYRGHNNANKHKLIPSIMRKSKNGEVELQKEDFYYHKIKVQCAESFQNNTHIDQLVRMQHYNCPTRLLDVTSNPLVALYFACKNYSCEMCKPTSAGMAYIFAVTENEVLYYDSDKARMLASLPPFSYTDKKDIYRICIEKMKKGEKFNASNNGPVIEKLYHEIRTEIPSFEKNMNPVDLLSSFFICPLKTNSRILKQDGAFIINGLSLDEHDMENKLENMVYKKIKVENQAKILKELDMLGINEATLFPEVDRVADYLKSK